MRGRLAAKRCSALLVGLLLATGAVAEMVGENLVQGLPTGYKIVYQGEQGPIRTTEVAPEAESPEAWTELLTTQIYLGLKSVSPAQFEAESQRKWLDACKEGKFSAIASGEEKGYPFAVWMLSCPYSKAPGRPEITWFKALRGADNFYVVQKAFRFEPSHEQVGLWMQYLKQISLCDSRLPERPCPKVD
ncbi:MAG: hypothetical protein WC023_15550 [Rhodocyclaceae bacterium]|jgi:hypothetical protein